jgi:short subunit fatty acids transporter
MYENIYIIAIILFSGVLLYLFIINQREHQKELDKIDMLEKEEKQNKMKIEEARKKTLACPYHDLTNPRQCYFGSNYMCSWNPEAERCDKKN